MADEEFGGAHARGPFGGPVSTFTQSKADPLYGLRHATLGSMAAEMTGRRLDGVEDRLFRLRGVGRAGRFLATWCQPCIDALSDVRALVAELPADRFTLLAITVDARARCRHRLPGA